MNANRTAHRIDGLVALVLFALALWLSNVTRERSFEGRLNSDEPEWIAISILHWNQVTKGGAAAGAEFDSAAEGSDNAWKQGVQRTTFGYMNPGLPKLIWGATLAANGHTDASPLVFQSFHRTNPAAGRAAQDALLPAEDSARDVVVVLSALSAVLLFFAARELFPGLAGWSAAAVAFALWFFSPLVQNTSGYIRTDYFMLPPCLAAFVLSMRMQRPSWTNGIAFGVLCGLAVSSKLNGGLLCVAVAAWYALAVLRDRTSWRSALVALACAALVTVLLFYALNPRLWSDPIDGVRDMLARWDKLMAFFQDELAPRTNVAVARTLSERVALFMASLDRDLPLGWFGAGLAGLGALGAGWSARDPATRERTFIALAFVAIFIGGTVLWLPLDWERFYLTALPALLLLQVWPIGLFIARVARPSPQNVA